MSGIFPDSGVPPNDARNSLPAPDTVNCDELWHSTSRCAPRFDPAAANAVMSELLNLINKGEVQYNCGHLANVELAVRYIAQRGLTTGAYLQGGPFDYSGALDPTLTRYNNFLTLVVIPAMDNQAAVTINIDNKGPAYLLRNDGQHLEAKDLRAGVPTIISYWGGYWWHVGLCSSQVPIVVKGAVDIWIRTDGNDATGDGSLNDPSKAFQTIQGAWAKVGSRYAATPLFTMDFKLGIPGTYAGATLGPFGGNVILGGAGGGTRADYRITTIDIGNNTRSSVFLAGMASVTLRNLTFVNDVAPPLGGSIVRCHDSGVTIDGCDWDSIVGNNLSFFIVSLQGGNCAAAAGNFTFNGRNLPLGGIIQTDTSATYIGCLDIRGANYYFNNIPAGVAQFAASSVSTIRMQVSNLFSTNCTGVEYIVTENSIINMQGQTCPGTIAGVKASGGQFIP